MLPSFFLIKRTRAPKGEMLGRVNPCSSNSCNYVLRTRSSSGTIWYMAREIDKVRGNKSIPNCTSLNGGKIGTSSGNTSANSLTTKISHNLGLTTLWWLQLWLETPSKLCQLVSMPSGIRSNCHLYPCLNPKKWSLHSSWGKAALSCSGN